MSRGRPRSPIDSEAIDAFNRLHALVAAQKWTAADVARHAGTSTASAWRALTTEPPRWTDSFVKIHEFVKSQSETPAHIPPTLESAVDAAAQGSKHATAALLRAIADMLERSSV